MAWIQALLDGYLAVIVSEEGTDLELEQDTLLDTARRLLRP